jgi:hypothetical protein
MSVIGSLDGQRVTAHIECRSKCGAMRCAPAGRVQGPLALVGSVVGAVYGYRVLFAMSKVLAVGMTALLVLGIFAYAPPFTTSALPEAGGCLLGGFRPTWSLAAVAAGLKIFNRRSGGGIYRYRAVWNRGATASWALCIDLLAVPLPSYEGPLPLVHDEGRTAPPLSPSGV